MKISLKDIQKSGKSSFHYEYEASMKDRQVVINGRDIKFIENPVLEMEITKDNNEIYASVSVDLDVTLNCVRCLKEFPAKGVVNMEGVFRNEDDFDIDTILLDGDTVDFDKLIDDALFKMTLDYLYCKDDCKGLCKFCGVDLNEETCDCQKGYDNIDPRLEGLKDLLK